MKSLWRYIAVIATVAALGGAAAGIVAAQTDEGTPTQTEEPSATPDATEDGTTPDASDDTSDRPTREEAVDNFLARLAEELGISQEQVEAAIRATSLGLLDDAVADGRITEDEAANIRERIESGEGLGLFPFRGFGPGSHGGPGLCLGASLDEIAEFLQLEPAELREQIQGGQTLVQVAEAQDVSRGDLVNFLVGQVQERLDQAVADGDITQAEADEKLTNARERIEELVDREGPAFEGGRFRPGRFAPLPSEGDVETSGLTL